METTVIREQKYVLVSGIVCALLFSSISLIFCIIKIWIAAILFLPFILLGIHCILMYYRHFIKLKTNTMIVSEPFKKNRIIHYAEIGTVLIQATNLKYGEHVEVILLNHQKKRLLKFARNMINADKLINIIEDREIPFHYLFGMVAAGQDIEEYFPALTKWEQSFYRPQIRIIKIAKQMKASNKVEKIKKEKRLVKKLDWIMIGIDILAIILSGKKLTFVLYIFVLLLVWELYIWMYPNLFFVVPKGTKGRKYIIEMPVLGPGVAAIFCLALSKNYMCNFDSADFLVFLGIIIIILLFPFALKHYRIKEKLDKARIILVVFLAFLLAFATVIPINYSATFQSDGHESIIVNDKDMFSSRYIRQYSIYADWREENQEFSVSKSQYNEYQKGDHLQVCLRHSIFGFHYWTVHK